MPTDTERKINWFHVARSILYFKEVAFYFLIGFSLHERWLSWYLLLPFVFRILITTTITATTTISTSTTTTTTSTSTRLSLMVFVGNDYGPILMEDKLRCDILRLRSSDAKGFNAADAWASELSHSRPILFIILSLHPNHFTFTVRDLSFFSATASRPCLFQQ